MTESIHLLTGAYAVDALDPDERAEFEGHLDGCADCRDELTGLIETAARLGSAAAITPPASLKAAVLGQKVLDRHPLADLQGGGGPGIGDLHQGMPDEGHVADHTPEHQGNGEREDAENGLGPARQGPPGLEPAWCHFVRLTSGPG